MEKEKNDILYMAPLMGATSYIYRNMYFEYFQGYDKAIAPFVSSCNIQRINPKYLRDLLPERNALKERLIPQILSKDPDEFIIMIKALSDLGYSSFNWNLGCPYPMVRKKMRGSGLLSHPDKICLFLDKVMPKIDGDLSIKVRLGCEHKDELLSLLPKVNAYPLEEIIIHPRTAIQLYGGEVDLTAFKECLEIAKHKVGYSGDINTVEDFNRLKNRFPQVYSWMIGRGGVIDPFLPQKIRGGRVLSLGERVHVFSVFHNAILKEYSQILSGPGHILAKMKELWSYWYKAFPGGEHFYQKVCRIKKIEPYRSFVKTFLKQKKAQDR